MTARENALGWLFALTYTGYVCGVAFLFPWLLGDVAGSIVAFVMAIGPLFVWSFWRLR